VEYIKPAYKDHLLEEEITFPLSRGYEQDDAAAQRTKNIISD
jgi:hypothetical protein